MANAVLYDVLLAVQSEIRALSLDGIAGCNIVVQKVPSDQPKDLPASRFPAVLIAPYGPEVLNSSDGTNSRDDILYPVVVVLLAADNGNQTSNFNTYLTWRETIRRSFHNQALSTLCYQVQVQPQDIVDRSAWFDRNLFASGLVLRCFSREGRL